MQGRVSRPRPVLRFLYSSNTTLSNNTRAGSADPGQYSGSYIVPIPLLLIILGPGQQTQTSAQVPIQYSDNTTLNNNTRAGLADPGQCSGSYIL